MTDRFDYGLQPHQARMNITWAGQNGDLLDPVAYDATDAQLKLWAVEALQGGSIPGIRADPHANLDDFVVDRFPAGDAMAYNRVFVRPKTPFGR